MHYEAYKWTLSTTSQDVVFEDFTFVKFEMKDKLPLFQKQQIIHFVELSLVHLRKNFFLLLQYYLILVALLFYSRHLKRHFTV